ncbi:MULTISPECIES: PTS ascorbate transporter subunit IIC [unclassified Bifidobacterium]|uniref:PTS ascorbate transporter subunit IIC n=1 Tax=unclassified Bifidobacterium TaxID=2608897 RepID=UPI0023FA2FF2|nr:MULTISPECIES: PTS ascorbate transporter subunit IIC [unclassified Bifidobacterium]WEV65967.1 PTS ascorbate transporter subunit IIC [Bifidobacterium sp. ESL0764]WEV75244.1 PTS ascorbate transporter subunit IIC [Bifidobacterium sp. ESL0800]
MNVLATIFNFISQQILNVPAYIIGLVAAVGLIALKKNVGQIISGALKAAMGYLILQAGASVVSGSLNPFGQLILKATGAHGAIATNEVIVAQAAKDFGASSAYIVVISFVLMLLLARFTPLKYVFLTGHHMVFMSTLLALVLSFGFGAKNSWLVVGLGAILMAVIMVATPSFAQPFMNRITGSDQIAIGHFGTLSYVVSGALGTVVGKKSKSTEDINFSKNTSFLRDSMVSTTVLMIVLYLVFAVIGAFALPAKVAFSVFPSAPKDYGAYFMAAFGQALQFGIGIAIILYGVRLILGELVPAFQGIAKKVVPGAKPALDIPIVFPYGSNASLIGFLSSFVGGLVALAVIAVWLGPMWGLALILPVPHFFGGGGAGVFGNATGGRKGAILGGFVTGIIITILPAMLMTVMGSYGLKNATFSDSDFCWYGLIAGKLSSFGPVAGTISLLIVAAVIFGLACLWQVKVVNKGWVPGAAHAAFIESVKKQEDAEREAERAAEKAAKKAAKAAAAAKA